MKNLDIALDSWVKNPDHYSIRTYRNPDTPQYLRFLASVKPIPPDPFGLMIGNVLHNLRGAIDHLAFALTVRGTAKRNQALSKKVADSSQFPIYGMENVTSVAMARTLYNKNGFFPRRIGGIAKRAQAIIKSLQPYNRGKNYPTDPLWILRELSNTDKHKLIWLSSWLIKGILARHTSDPNGLIGKIHVESKFMSGETEVAYVEIAPEFEMDVQLVPTFDIAFSDGPANGKLVRETINTIHRHIETRVFGRLNKFL